MKKKEREMLQQNSVTYDVAFALRQKGFREISLAYYMQGHGFFAYPPPDYTYSDESLKEWCIAPLWQQVIDWLWDKHQIFLSPEITYDSMGNIFYYSIRYKKFGKENIQTEISEDKTEALKYAILQAIKLI